MLWIVLAIWGGLAVVVGLLFALSSHSDIITEPEPGSQVVPESPEVAAHRARVGA